MMVEAGRISKFARYAFIGVLVAMAGLVIYAVLNQPRPITDSDIDATVDALRTRTAVAAPVDLEATIDARLKITATPTPPASPSDAVNNVVGGVGGFITSIWNFFGFAGIFSQGLCCILLPGLILLGILRDPPRPK
ncbi:MAG TPA: hypothetical protein VHL11_12620 [Phototrophicaceae bacterium]|jgi:hypothetical protein|nr:hypothetical protein [Phototrophicaceae bacterium]